MVDLGWVLLAWFIFGGLPSVFNGLFSLLKRMDVLLLESGCAYFNLHSQRLLLDTHKRMNEQNLKHSLLCADHNQCQIVVLELRPPASLPAFLAPSLPLRSRSPHHTSALPAAADTTYHCHYTDIAPLSSLRCSACSDDPEACTSSTRQRLAAGLCK